MRGQIIEFVLEVLLVLVGAAAYVWIKRSGQSLAEKIPLSKSVREQLKYTNPLKNEREVQVMHQKKKLLAVVLVLTCGFGLAAAITGGSLLAGQEELRELARKETGKGGANYTLYVEGEEERETYRVSVDIDEREPQEQEAEIQFQKIYEALRKRILGENASFDKVTENLYLPETMEEFGCSIYWITDNWQVIDYSGTVKNEELTEACLVYLTAEVGYGKYEKIFYFSVMVYPKEKREGIWIDEVKKQIQRENAESPEQKAVALPAAVGNKKVSYYGTVRESGMQMAAFGILLAVVLWIGTDYELRDRKKKREEELLLEYASAVSELTLLVQAGMTIRLAWEKIVEDKLRRKQNSAVREEMQMTYYELKQGIAEGTAYRNFGRRIGLKPYRKLGSLLEQNLRKGTSGLVRLLEEEVTESFELRKSRALMAGEEAGTKLLIPMFLMLVVVMVICIAPALLIM